MGLVGRREAISAPTVRYASDCTADSTARAGPASISAGTSGETGSSVTKSSKRPSAMSTTHTAHNDQANHAAVRRLIGLTLRPCCLAPCVTTPLYSTTVSQALRQALRQTLRETKVTANFVELREAEVQLRRTPFLR